MRFKLFFAFLLVLWCISANAADTVEVRIKLQKLQDGAPEVVMHFPELKQGKLRIVFPTYVPGSFNELAPGNLVENIVALKKDTEVIVPKQTGINTFEIASPKDINTLTYRFSFSWKIPVTQHGFFPQLGTAYKNEHYILLNFGSMLPFIEGRERLPIKITIEKSAIYTAFSPLSKIQSQPDKEVFFAKNYLQLIDNPVVLTSNYETTFRTGGTQFHCITNTFGKLSEQALLKTLKPVCEGVTKFCKSLNVKDYYFFIFLVDSGDIGTKVNEEDYGAVQHSASSVMVFKNHQDLYKIQKEIQQTASHELFHLFQPLNLKTDATSKLNVKAKLPTEHLWLFEGVTEYFSLLMQWREDLITRAEFIQEVRNKMSLMQFFEPFSLTEKSTESILNGNETYYRNFYYKGCVAAMMLDLRLLELSQGQLNLQELLLRFKRSMGENYVVKDEELIAELVKISSFTELDDFFKNYISGVDSFHYNKYLSLIGWAHEPVKEDTSKMYVNASFRYEKGSKNVYLTNINIDQLGFEEGDVLLKINNKKVYKDNVEDLMEKVSALNSGKNATFTVKRKGKELKLSGKPLIVNKNQRNVIKVEKRPPPEKQFYRNAYKSGQLNTGKPYRMLN
ncbi:MAG: PDZ domain-containing protein [Chitinophagales bacterium]|nr:PDZ domain-containing protein [Chitinophagales bacterium]